ncbi:MAG: hypothetical protein NVSMB53_12000 [Gemmatimonadaceae bacterium]
MREIDMKDLYKRVVVGESRLLGEPASAPREVASLESIEAAERALGIVLPETFKQFAQQVGHCSWPVEIFPVGSLAYSLWDRPKYFIAFATDGGGNDWCFDTRTRTNNEYSIEFWDHEEPPDLKALEEPSLPTTFDEWLEELVSEALADEERRSLEDRRRAIEEALEPHRESNVWPWGPSDGDIARIQASIGFKLPDDYIWFTTKLGSTEWPMKIPDATEVGRLSLEMKRRFPGAASDTAVAFAKEADGSFVAFEADGRLIAVGGSAIKDQSFFELLQRRIEEASAPKGPASAGGTHGEHASEQPQTSFPDRIIDVDNANNRRTNAVWRAVASAKAYTATPCPDGRVCVEIAEFRGGSRRIFIDPDSWATVARHLRARDE